MGLSFIETMRGELTDSWGAVHPIRFDIKAEASHSKYFLRTGKARLTGVVMAAPWVSEAVVEGEIEVRPLVGRYIRYHFSFEDEEGKRYQFQGQKTMSWLRPVHSMTALEGELSREGEVLARGGLQFDLNALMQFAGTWLSRPSIQGVDLGQSTVDGTLITAPLSSRRRAILEAYASAAICEGENIPAVDERTVEQALLFISHMPATLRGGYATALDGLQALSRLRTGRAFTSLSVAKRRELVEEVMSGQQQGPAVLLNTLAMPIKQAHFSREDYRIAVGVPDYKHVVREPLPDYMQSVTPVEELEPTSELEVDVVVVGTGAGGAAVAAELVEQGLVVVMVEAGRYRHRQHFSGDPMKRGLSFWRDRGLSFTVGNCTATLPTGELVGGTTTINSGTCFNTPSDVMSQWREMGLSADFNVDSFAPYFEKVNAELRVSPGDKRYLGRVANTVGRGADALGFGHGPLRRNAEGCDGQGTCIYGCPTDAKRSTNVSYVPRALKAGAFLYTGLRVTHLLRQGRRVNGVLASGVDEGGLTKQVTFKARAVVLATGSLVTPALLQDNGFSLPQLGRNLSIHPGFGVYCKMPEASTPWRAIPQGYGFHGHGLEGVQFEGFYLPPSMSAITLPAVGQGLSHWMEEPSKVDQFGFMVRDENNGRVLRSPLGGVLVYKSLTDRTVRRLQLGVSLLSEVLLRGGATEVLTCMGHRPSVRTVEEAKALANEPVTARDFTVLGAHPLATCRIGASEDTGCVDNEHRVFGTDNLYVVDGSAVPTSLGVNPQITIMAMALRAGGLLAARLL